MKAHTAHRVEQVKVTGANQFSTPVTVPWSRVTMPRLWVAMIPTPPMRKAKREAPLSRDVDGKPAHADEPCQRDHREDEEQDERDEHLWRVRLGHCCGEVDRRTDWRRSALGRSAQQDDHDGHSRIDSHGGQRRNCGRNDSGCGCSGRERRFSTRC